MSMPRSHYFGYAALLILFTWAGSPPFEGILGLLISCAVFGMLIKERADDAGLHWGWAVAAFLIPFGWIVLGCIPTKRWSDSTDLETI